jgi:hypothetical protein
MQFKINIDKKKLIEKTSEILNLLDMPPLFSGDNRRVRFFNKNGYSIGLRDDAVDAFEQALKIISDCPSYIDISSKRIEDEFIQLLINIKINNLEYNDKIIKKELDNYFDILNQSLENYRVLIPIDSFKLDGISELRIGKVLFIDYNSIHENIESEFLEIFDQNPAIPLEEKEFRKMNFEQAIESFRNRVCADITVYSELIESYSKALNEVENTLNLLRFYIPLLYSQDPKVKIEVYGNHNNIISGFRSLLSIKQYSEFNCRMERFGPLELYIMSQDRLNYLRQNCYLDLLGSIFSKDKKDYNDLERRIINSIRWIGTGIQISSNCDKFLMYIIAIESLLGDEKEKAAPIAERCAFLLSDVPEKRIQNDKKMKSLYDTRSKIVHEGVTEITAEDAGSAQWMAISCLFAVCKRLNNWQNLDQIKKWIREQRYGMNNKAS